MSEEASNEGSKRAGVGRNPAIDILKGALVVFMAFYHAINYTPHFNLAFVVMAFLPPSFIFVTGFLLTQIYTAKYPQGRGSLYLRLLQRGIKLLVLFTVLNLAIHIVLMPGHDPFNAIRSFFSRWQSVYLTGAGRAAAFEILLPIGYFLCLSPPLFLILFRSPRAIQVLAVLAIGACWWLESRASGLDNLMLVSAGLLGMAAGVFPLESIRRTVRWWAISVPVFIIVRAMSIWKGESYPVQTLDVLVTVLFLLVVIDCLQGPGGAWSFLERLGKYSLVAYIAQIGFLQVFVRLVGPQSGGILNVALLFLATLLISHIAAWLTDYCRKRFQWTDWLYHAAFA